MSEAILKILEANGLDPNKKTGNGQTNYERVEAAILGVLEEIEDEE